MILQTKLQRPPVAPDSILRERLIDLLMEGQHCPVTLITAPAGYGKSTLASKWAEDCGLPYGWVSLDKQDNDLRQFLKYLLAALNRIFQAIPLHTATLVEANRLPSPEEIARYLLNDLVELSQPFLLVLDDYHIITEGSIHDLVNALLEHPARNMRMVLVSRKDPALPIASLRARGELHEIRSKDLRFTSDEVAKFMNQSLNVVIDDDTVSLLDDRIEGWATGLRLASLYLQGSKDLKIGIKDLHGNHLHIAEYLMAEVLARQRTEIANYLLETSILERFCESLCFHIHQIGSLEQDVSASEFIQLLSNNNLFVVSLDDKGDWFRYHHLFRDFLNEVLHKQRTADQIAELHRSAGNWFAENDLIEEAIGHFMAAGETSAAIQLVVDRRYEMLNASSFVRLGRLLKFLPEKEVAENPLFASAQALIGIEQGNDANAQFFTETAIQMVAALSPKSETYAMLKGEVLVLQGLVEYFWGNAQSGLTHAEESIDYLPEDALMIRSLRIGIISVCLQAMGNGKQAVASLRNALSIPIWPTNIQARFHFYLSLVRYMEGNLAGVINASRECLWCIKDSPFFHTRAFANYFLGAGHYLLNELEAAVPYLMKVLDDRHTANPSYVAQAGFILACIHLSQDNQIATAQVLDQIRAYCRNNDHVTVLSIVQAFEAEFALRRGDLQRAQQICKDRDFDIRPPLWFYYVPELTPIKWLLTKGTEISLQEAHNRLIELEERMRRINRINVRIEILALLALVCHRQSDEAAALEHLQTALDLAEPGGWIRTFVDLGMPMIDVLKILVQHQPGHAYAQQTLEACQAEHRRKASSEPDAATKPQINERPPENPLTRREIEIFPLLAEGLSNKEIAARLYIAPVTVKTHLQNIYKKLNTKNRIEALKKAREIGINIDN